jgi:hypothetical protein
LIKAILCIYGYQYLLRVPCVTEIVCRNRGPRISRSRPDEQGDRRGGR